ncbi:hypothetical protein OESDEN_07696 [Oesophagostomum dentatum]|uniref:C-type lectin domain-containing protein n=1 Tax=Oesophagostomum dentatum TaxID=61180 RepID=A0A0B1T4A9_OESDE|nr:hypothetical protein OESDEN_07696 [Oesophagostomum dentatum]
MISKWLLLLALLVPAFGFPLEDGSGVPLKCVCTLMDQSSTTAVPCVCPEQAEPETTTVEATEAPCICPQLAEPSTTAAPEPCICPEPEEPSTTPAPPVCMCPQQAEPEPTTIAPCLCPQLVEPEPETTPAPAPCLCPVQEEPSTTSLPMCGCPQMAEPEPEPEPETTTTPAPAPVVYAPRPPCHCCCPMRRPKCGCGCGNGCGNSVAEDAVVEKPAMQEALICPEGWFRYQDSCYLMQTTRMTLPAAERLCNENGGTLFVADSLSEYNTVMKESPLYFWSWIGLGQSDASGYPKWHVHSSAYPVRCADEKCLPADPALLPDWDGAYGMNPTELKWLITPFNSVSNGWSTSATCVGHYNIDIYSSTYLYFYPCSYEFYSICERNLTLAGLGY